WESFPRCVGVRTFRWGRSAACSGSLSACPGSPGGVPRVVGWRVTWDLPRVDVEGAGNCGGVGSSGRASVVGFAAQKFVQDGREFVPEPLVERAWEARRRPDAKAVWPYLDQAHRDGAVVPHGVAMTPVVGE